MSENRSQLRRIQLVPQRAEICSVPHEPFSVSALIAAHID
eukprot:COSAG06_NODE_45643_length_353_cov_0.755906_1_plen_39_part_01